MTDPHAPLDEKPVVSALPREGAARSEGLNPRQQGRRHLGARLIMRCGATLALTAIGVTLFGLGREIMNDRGLSFWPVILGVGVMALVPGLILYFCGRRIFQNGPDFGPGLVLALTGLPVLALGGFIAFGPSPRILTGGLTILGAAALITYGLRVIFAARRGSP